MNVVYKSVIIMEESAFLTVENFCADSKTLGQHIGQEIKVLSSFISDCNPNIEPFLQIASILQNSSLHIKTFLLFCRATHLSSVIWSPALSLPVASMQTVQPTEPGLCVAAEQTMKEVCNNHFRFYPIQPPLLQIHLSSVT